MFRQRLIKLTVAVAVIIAGLLLAVDLPVFAQSTITPPSTAPNSENTLGAQSDAEVWRALRQGAPGLVSTKRGEDGVLINTGGTWWAQLRSSDGPLIQYGATGLAGVVGILALFFVLRGRLRITGGRSGTKIARFSLTHRVVHWVIAALFLLLALTGLILLFGRPALLPLIGKNAFSVVATASMQAHNLFGPIFIASLLAFFFTFVRGNFPIFKDIGWFLRLGGIFGGHASAGRYNAGEKAWFWASIAAGLVLSASGILLSFPDALAVRNQLHLSELAHAIAALVFIGFALGHIYLATIGTEGTLEGMIDGEVDENWARTHHDLWFAELDTAKKGDQQ